MTFSLPFPSSLLKLPVFYGATATGSQIYFLSTFPADRLCADFVLLILTSPVKREFCLNDFRAFISFCQQFLYLVILKILLYHFGAFMSDCQVFTHIF